MLLNDDQGNPVFIVTPIIEVYNQCELLFSSIKPILSDTVFQTMVSLFFNLILRKSYILTPMKNELYTKKLNHPVCSHFKRNNIREALHYLTKLNIVDIVTGNSFQKRTTRVFLNDPTEWLVDDTLLKRYEIVKTLGKPFERVDFLTVDKERIHISQGFSSNINNYMIDKFGIDIRYRQIFGSNRHEYGRFYSWYSFLSKNERNAINNNIGYEELDYQAMSIQVAYLLETGAMYNGDPYADFTKLLIGFNLNQMRQHDDDFTEVKFTNTLILYRKLFKTPIAMMLFSKSREDAVKAIRNYFCKIGFNFEPSDKELQFPFSWDYKHEQARCKFFNNLAYENKETNVYYSPVSVDTFITSFEKFFELIRNRFYSSFAAFYQHVEVENLQNIITELMRHDAMILTVHDSFSCPTQFVEYFKKFMITSLIETCSRYRAVNQGNTAIDTIITVNNVYNEIPAILN